jgi:DNA-damage-inducible protein D
MNKLVLFQEIQIRRIWHDNDWYYSIVDIIGVLTDSKKPRDYWSILKKREPQLPTICRQLKLEATDGKKYATDCANTEGVLRIIMSVPSPKAEPFKLWMAQVSTERIAEIENPELSIERANEIYEAKGYPKEWISMRLKAIGIRNELTDEWKKRGIREGQEYSILTAEIAKATFGITPAEHKTLKGLAKENLRDHMTNLELIFSMLGEEVTRGLVADNDVQGFMDNHQAAIQGGEAAGAALERLESKTGKKVISSKNFKSLENPQDLIE